MLKACHQEKNTWLRIQDIQLFPCIDLRTIDQLWVRYSNGRFGFSVQKRIWQSVGENLMPIGKLSAALGSAWVGG